MQITMLSQGDREAAEKRVETMQNQEFKEALRERIRHYGREWSGTARPIDPGLSSRRPKMLTLLREKTGTGVCSGDSRTREET